MSEVILTTGGMQHRGWTSIRIQTGIQQISGSFELSLTQKWPGQPTARSIRMGEACTVAIDGETVITGYVDDVEPAYDADNNTLMVRGRDKTGDLVDCSAETPQGGFEFADVNLAQIAQVLCRPFGVGVQVQTNIGEKFEKFAIQPGESVFECIERAARMRGVLLMSDGLGHLILGRAGTGRAGAALIEGETILRARALFSIRDRYSRYIGRAQSPGNDSWGGEQAAEVRAEVFDSQVPRNRPLILVAEDSADGSTLRERITWERNVRFGRGSSAEITVADWKHDGVLWRKNMVVPLQSPSLAPDVELLIAGCEYVLNNEEGTVTRLTLTRPEAFDVQPLPPKADTDHGWIGEWPE